MAAAARRTLAVGRLDLASRAAMALLWPLSGWRQRALLIAARRSWQPRSPSASGRSEPSRPAGPQERERRVTAASQHLAGDLHAALHRAERLAACRACQTRHGPRTRRCRLGRLVPSGRAGDERGGASTPGDALGLGRPAPAAAARRRRLDRCSRATGYYVVLEARRHSADGRSAVAGVLIWAHPAVPDRDRSLAELFRQRTEVGSRSYPAGTAPRTVPTCSTTRSPRPPVRGCSSACSRPAGAGRGQGAGLRARTAGRRLAGAARPSSWRSASQPGALERIALLSGLLWLAVRAPRRARARAPAALLAGHLLPAAAGAALRLRRRARRSPAFC